MKKTLLTTTLLSTFFLTPSLLAETHMFIFGGGGEPLTNADGTPNPKTIFDVNLDFYSQYAKNGQVKSKVLFNGGHANTEAIIRNNFKPESVVANTFEKAPLEKTIEGYIAEIKLGNIKKNEQLMVIVDTHGAVKSSNELTHQIALGKSPLKNLNTLGSNVVSLDILEKLRNTANEYGVKLAIIDQSCHSGNTLNLKNDKTCVIAATGPDHYGFAGNTTTFSAQMAKNLVKGKNLEEAYLNARRDSSDAGFPMISTAAGNSTHLKLYALIGPYINYFEKGQTKINEIISNTSTKEAMCKSEVAFSDLLSFIDRVQSINGFLSQANLDHGSANWLKDVLKKYHFLIQDIRKRRIALGSEVKGKREEFCEPYQTTVRGKKVQSKQCTSYTYDSMVTIDYPSIRKYFTAEKATAKGDKLSELEATLTIIDRAHKRSLEIKKLYPTLGDLDKVYQEVEELEKRSYEYAHSITKGLKKLYDDQYKLESENANRPNPCRDFVL